MTGIENVEKYIANTKMKAAPKYVMSLMEFHEFCSSAETNLMGAVLMAFNYGRAKGYRMAKAEAKS